jgi:N6-L-threonylcarbamoyladenine synthase
MATILAIETSCDDTAAAVVTDGHVRSNVISSQEVHSDFGGVVPELASRAHQRLIVPIVSKALRDADCERGAIDAVAVTRGPGLSGSLLVGLSFAKAFALGRSLPLLGINHLEGHIYSVFMTEHSLSFPYLCLIVSGGHTELIHVENHFTYNVLGRTRDDAAGEAFDKVATLLGLDYPGGPVIDRLAQGGDRKFHRFPRSRLDGFDFSFSGLKTSVLYYLNDYSEVDREELLARHREDLCASFQEAVVDVLVEKLRHAVKKSGITDVAIVGGVSANSRLRELAGDAAAADGFSLYVPPLEACMDNAAMIGISGHHRHRAGRYNDQYLSVEPNLAICTDS